MARKKAETEAVTKESAPRKSRKTADAVKTVSSDTSDVMPVTEETDVVSSDSACESMAEGEQAKDAPVEASVQPVTEETEAVDEDGEADSVADKGEDEDATVVYSAEEVLKNVTESIALEESVEDDQLMMRLRTKRLNAAEIYQEAQAFFAQNLDIDSLLRSNETNLVVNTIEILSRHEQWHDGAVSLLNAADSQIMICARQYALEFIPRDPQVALKIVDKLVEIVKADAKDDSLTAYAMRTLNAITVRMSRTDDDAASWLAAFIRILAIMDARRIDHMIYDSCPLVRIGVMRHLIAESSIQINTLASALILLKDSNENVNEAVLKVVARFASYPEIAVPVLIDYLARGGLHAQLVYDAFRHFDDDANTPLLAALSEQSDAKAEAVKQIILASPQRYVEPLKAAWQSFRTRPQAKPRIYNILVAVQECVDSNVRVQIVDFLKPPAAPDVEMADDMESSKKVDLMAPIFNKDDRFYSEVLDDAALANYTRVNVNELQRLLQDSRDTTRLNAINLARVMKCKASDIRSTIGVWTKCFNEDIARAAFDAYLETYEGDKEPVELTQFVIDAISASENRIMAAEYFGRLKKNQNHINNIIEIYRKTPLKYQSLVLRIVKDNPSEETIKHIGACLVDGNDGATIATTMQLLVKNNIDFDFNPYRKRMLEIVVNPPSKGEFATVMRLYALMILNKLVKEGDYDKQIVDVLRSCYKKFYYPEYKKIASEILKKMDEDTFDDLEEDDDFEDLEEDDD